MLEVALPAQAQTYPPADPAAIALKVRDRNIDLTIAKTQELRVVLDRVCADLQLACEGTSNVSSLKVVPLQLSGPLNAIVAKLLEGTGLNYSVVASVGPRQGRLVIGIPTATADNKVRSTSPVTPTQPPSGMVVFANDPVPPNQEATHTSAEQPVVNSADLASAPAGSLRVSSQSSPAGGRDPVNLPTSREDSGPAVESMSGRDGKPIFVTKEESSIEPMPDRTGKPIRVIPSNTAIEPLPDSKGNAIPVTLSPAPR